MAIPLIKLGLAAAASYLFFKSYRRHTLSTTTASEAMDDIPHPRTRDQTIDAGVKETFPASDPVSVVPDETAYEREQRKRPH